MPSAGMETAYVIDQSSNVVKQSELILSAFPSVPMFTVVQSHQQPRRLKLYQTLNSPVTISAAGTFQQNVQTTSSAGRSYVAQQCAPVWTTDTIKQRISSQPSSAVTSQAGKPTKSKIDVKIRQPGKNVSTSVRSSTSGIEKTTESTSKNNEGSLSKQNGSEAEIPLNTMKVFKNIGSDGRYLISKIDGKTIVKPYDAKNHDRKIKETFITPKHSKLVFPSPHEGETIMVVAPSCIPMVGIGNSSRTTSSNDIKPKPGPASYKRRKLSSEESQSSKLPYSNERSKAAGPPMAKRTPEMTASTEFKPEKGQLDRIYDNKRLLKLRNYKTWSMQLLNQTEDKKTSKYIFIAETVLKGDEMMRQRMLKIHETLKFELFVFSNNFTGICNDKNALIRSFSALQELLDNFAAFNVCSGVADFAHIQASSYPKGRRVANCWYSNKCTNLCADTTVCAECTRLLRILSCIDLGNANHVEEEHTSSFQTEVLFVNPDASVNFVLPDKENAACVSLNDHSD